MKDPNQFRAEDVRDALKDYRPLPRFYVVKPEVAAKVRAMVPDLDNPSETVRAAFVGPAILAGIEVHTKVQEADCWSFSDRAVFLDYLNDNLTEKDLHGLLASARARSWQ